MDSRFYGEPDSAVTVRMVDAEFKYSFEYQGCLTGLVHTPLTDKCFLTLTQGTYLICFVVNPVEVTKPFGMQLI